MKTVFRIGFCRHSIAVLAAGMVFGVGICGDLSRGAISAHENHTVVQCKKNQSGFKTLTPYWKLKKRKRSVNGCEFSYDDTGALTARKNGKVKVLVKKGFSSSIVTNGNIVYYSLKTAFTEGETGSYTVYSIKANGTKRKKLFVRKRVADDFNLESYCKGKLYYKMGLSHCTYGCTGVDS